jgi:preprotein translocase subunit SecG
MLIPILLVVHVIVAIVIIVAVLLQQGQGANAGAAFGSGSAGTVFGAKGAASFLSRLTAILATVFMLNSTALAWYAANGMADEDALLEQTETLAPAQQEQPAESDGQQGEQGAGEGEEESDEGELQLPPDGR